MARAGSHRLQWQELPVAVRGLIEDLLGGPVVSAVGQEGGYGPGMAARCVVADERRYFVKAVSSAQNPDTPDMMRREAAINAALPLGTPAPDLLNALDTGEWVILVFEDVEGRLPGRPWTDDDLREVGRLSREVGAMTGHASLPSVAQRYATSFAGWRTLSSDESQVSDTWCRKHLARLVALESRWEEVVGGPALVHGDFRSDNIILRPERACLVDWTATCRGAAWFDLAGMLPSVEVAGGPPPELASQLLGLEMDTELLTPLVAAFAGYFARQGGLPDPPGLPTVRAFQRAQGEVTIQWLRRLVGWD